MNNLNGLLVVNVELTSRCNKSCWMCGRRKLERDYPEITNDYGDMDFDLACRISTQIPSGIIVQFHNNGDPLLYPRLGEVLGHYRNNFRCFNTNGKLLMEKRDEIINNLESITISVIPRDPDGDDQYDIVNNFIHYKGIRKPFVVYRLLGTVENPGRWYDLGGPVATRTLHNPMGSFGYQRNVTIPEHGMCLDLMGHLSIDRFGNVYPCVRFNPHRHNLLGNVMFMSLEDMWNGETRRHLVYEHSYGNRNCSEMCKTCEFYGCPTG